MEQPEESPAEAPKKKPAKEPAAAPQHETITLAAPLRRGEQEIADLQLRKPRAGELRGLDIQQLLSGDVNALLVLIPRITNPPVAAVEAEEFDLADIAQIAGVVRSFFMSAAEVKAVEKYLGLGGEPGT